ncbi:MAG: DUF1254 domain-containing protein [Variovorax sp.]
MMIRSKHHVGQGSPGDGTVQTRYGALTFKDGRPTDESADRLAQMLLFGRAVEIYQQHLPAVSMFQFRQGLARSGVSGNGQVVIWKALLDAGSAARVGRAESVFACSFLDLKRDGPIVIDAPPGIHGVLDDMWMRFVADVGAAGPDGGRGGRYLVLAPNHDGAVPEGHFVVRSPTFGIWMLLNPADQEPIDAVRRFRSLRIHPLAQSANPPAMEFLNRSDGPIDTNAPSDFSFFEQLGQLVEQESAEAVSPLERFYLTQIGMHFGRRFAADETMQSLLAEAALVGMATMQAQAPALVAPAAVSPTQGHGEWQRMFQTGDAFSSEVGA